MQQHSLRAIGIPQTLHNVGPARNFLNFVKNEYVTTKGSFRQGAGTLPHVSQPRRVSRLYKLVTRWCCHTVDVRERRILWTIHRNEGVTLTRLARQYAMHHRRFAYLTGPRHNDQETGGFSQTFKQGACLWTLVWKHLNYITE